jgi:hypothetical protein
LKDLAVSVLEDVSGELESQVARNTVVDTGQLKSSWTHRVTSTETKTTGEVGSPLQNAIWEEFGTGEYALHGDGRKGGWFYEDAEGKGHFTHGKHPRRALWNAYTTMKSKMIKRIQDVFKGGMK